MSRPATSELGNIGVLLLRHDGRPGRERVVKGDVAELAGIPDDDLLAEPREVNPNLGSHEGELGNNVASRGAIDRVGSRRGEPEVPCDGFRIQTE